jgi:hypothetical protein
MPVDIHALRVFRRECFRMNKALSLIAWAVGSMEGVCAGAGVLPEEVRQVALRHEQLVRSVRRLSRRIPSIVVRVHQVPAAVRGTPLPGLRPTSSASCAKSARISGRKQAGTGSTKRRKS